MIPESAAYLTKARADLSEARQIAAIGLSTIAARSAYYAAFHAAEAFIIERTGKVAKTHSGVRSEFNRLIKNSPAIDRPLTTFLAQAYKYKEISDYAIGNDAFVLASEAADAINSASTFIDAITAALGE